MTKAKFILGTTLILASSLNFAHAEEFDLTLFKAKLPNVSHQVKIIDSGLASFEQRLEMIESAKESIDVEYFIYNSDKSGKIFTQALIKKAREGVKIRMLLDTVMIKSQITPFYIHELRNEGIEVKYFNNTSILNLVRGMYRNHRKLLIVDDKTIITGGRNIGDEYFDLREDFNFLDREMLIEGDIVKTIAASFDVMWNSKISEQVDREKMPDQYDFKYNRRNSSGSDYYSDLNKWKKAVSKAQNFLAEDKSLNIEEIRSKGKELLAEAYTGTCDNIFFNSELPIVNKSNREKRIIKHDLYERIGNAKEKVLFDSPYFIVDQESKDALDKALNNKVAVEVLTNGLNSTDAIYVYDVFKSIVKDWINKGMVAYTFKGERPGYYGVVDESISKARFGVHAKTFVIDNKDTIIGTYNFDPRSANYNSEMVIGCENNPEMAKHVTGDIEKRMEGSFKLDTADKVDESAFYKVSFLKRLTYGILKIPSNIFDYLL